MFLLFVIIGVMTFSLMWSNEKGMLKSATISVKILNVWQFDNRTKVDVLFTLPNTDRIDTDADVSVSLVLNGNEGTITTSESSVLHILSSEGNVNVTRTFYIESTSPSDVIPSFFDGMDIIVKINAIFIGKNFGYREYKNYTPSLQFSLPYTFVSVDKIVSDNGENLTTIMKWSITDDSFHYNVHSVSVKYNTCIMLYGDELEIIFSSFVIYGNLSEGVYEISSYTSGERNVTDTGPIYFEDKISYDLSKIIFNVSEKEDARDLYGRILDFRIAMHESDNETNAPPAEYYVCDPIITINGFRCKLKDFAVPIV